jgi:hypothetical protein
MSESTTLVFRPSVRAYVRNTLAIAGIGMPVIAALIILNGNKAVFAVAIAVAAAGSIGGVLLYIARARIYVTPDSIGRRGFGRTQWLSRAAVQRSLLVLRLEAGTAPPTHLFLFAPDSGLVMRLYGAMWGQKQLRALADALGVEQSVRAMPVTAVQLHALEPTALNWAETHPKEVTRYTVVGFVAIAVVIVWVMYSLR